MIRTSPPACGLPGGQAVPMMLAAFRPRLSLEQHMAHFSFVRSNKLIATLTLLLSMICGQSASGGDIFDQHAIAELKKGATGATPLTEISASVASKWKSLSAKVSAPCLIVQTNEGHWAKALLAWGQRKVKGREQPLQVLVLERFVTYRGDRDGVANASGKEVMLFSGLSFSFDIGQVVPTGGGADIELTEAGVLKPVGDAKLFAMNGSQFAAEEGAKPNPNDHEGVMPRDFTGTWKVTIDGRWTGVWEIKVDENRTVLGKFISAESQSRYELYGKVSNVPHQAKFEIELANAQLSVDAFLWTTDKSTMAGTVVMSTRKFGFVATRQE